MLTPISRKDAKQRMFDLFDEQRQKLDERFRPHFYMPTDPWERLRNYEIEMLLMEWFGGEWVVNESCPFNGDYCAWGRIQQPEPNG